MTTEMYALSIPTIGRVEAPVTVLRQLWAYCIAAMPSEVSAFVDTEIRGDVLRVTDRIFLIKQDVSPTHTMLDMGALATLVHNLTKQGASPKTLRLWWHTHPRMGAWFSHIDDNTITKLSGRFSVLLAGVFNEHGETAWRLVDHGLVRDWDHVLRLERPDDAMIEAARVQTRKVVAERRVFGISSLRLRRAWEMWEHEG